MVSFRSFTLFVYARFLRQSLIVVVRALLLLLLIHYFITVVLNYRRTLFKRSSRYRSTVLRRRSYRYRSFFSKISPILNRKNEENDNAVYTIKENWDQQWLDTAIDYDPDWEVVSVRLWSFLMLGQN